RRAITGKRSIEPSLNFTSFRGERSICWSWSFVPPAPPSSSWTTCNCSDHGNCIRNDAPNEFALRADGVYPPGQTMPNQYYVPGQKRAARVGDLFATIAPRYDLINDLQSFGLHRLWKQRLVRLANAQPGERALDVCCGTGDIAFALAQRGADVVGLDFSEPMLAVAGERFKLERPK